MKDAAPIASPARRGHRPLRAVERQMHLVPRGLPVMPLEFLVEGLRVARQGRLVGHVEAQRRDGDAPVGDGPEVRAVAGREGTALEGDPEIRIAAPVPALVEA